MNSGMRRTKNGWEMTEKNRKEMNAAGKDATARIRAAQAALNDKIAATHGAFLNGTAHWGHVGDLQHFATKLEELAGLIG